MVAGEDPGGDEDGGRTEDAIRQEIRQRLEDSYRPVPLVADVHHNGMKIALEVAQHVDKVRINPGLFVFDKPDPNRTEFSDAEIAAIGDRITDTFEPLVKLLKEQDKALRIGVNHGSLAERMLFSYGDTPLGMVESALEFLRIARDHRYDQIMRLGWKVFIPVTIIWIAVEGVMWWAQVGPWAVESVI